MGVRGNQTPPVFDGVSDFSETVSTIAMAIQDLVIARIGPFVSEGLATAKINNFIDTIISMAPDYFEIYDTGLFVEGWLYQYPKYRVDYMEIILKTTI